MSSKSIAVPLNPSARRGARLLAASDPGAPKTFDQAETALVGSGGAPMATLLRHRYHPGERLQMGGGGNIVMRAAAYCRIVSLLPYEGRGAFLYRVRSEVEAFERVVAEADLHRPTD